MIRPDEIRYHNLRSNHAPINEAVNNEQSVFLTPALDGYLVYAPRHGITALISRSAGEQFLSIAGGMDEAEILEAIGAAPFPTQTDDADAPSWAPSSVTFSNTQKCTLRCTYCYAEGGRVGDKVIDMQVARTSIEFVVKNAVEKKNTPSINFLGEGEATADWRSFTDIIGYFRSVCVRYGVEGVVELSTNGVFPESRASFLADQVDRIYFSMDSVPDVSDIQRPLPNGRGSSRIVVARMKYLDQLGKSYAVRSTVSQRAVEFMEPFVEYLAQETRCRLIHFEPAFDVNPYVGGDVTEDVPRAIDFTRNYRKALACGARQGIEVYFSGADLDLKDGFCGVTDARNFIVLSDGSVTACNEVLKDSDPRASTYKYGKISVDEILVDGRTQEKLRKFRPEFIQKCKGCFAKFNCGGDCYAKNFDNTQEAGRPPISDIYSDRCFAIRELLLDRILSDLASTGRTAAL